MNRKPGIFRTWGDALLCLGFAFALTGWLVVGLAILVASLRKGGL